MVCSEIKKWIVPNKRCFSGDLNDAETAQNVAVVMFAILFVSASCTIIAAVVLKSHGFQTASIVLSTLLGLYLIGTRLSNKRSGEPQSALKNMKMPNDCSDSESEKRANGSRTSKDQLYDQMREFNNK